MSHYHENVTWKTMDGFWRVGFFKPVSFWDDDNQETSFDTDEFEWVSRPFTDSNYATLVYSEGGYANPGSSIIVPDSSTIVREKYDLMARFYFDPEFAETYKENQHNMAAAKVHETIVKDLTNGVLHVGMFVNVMVAKDAEAVATGYGVFTPIKGVLQQNGNWITVEGHRLYNTHTQQVNGFIRSIKPVVNTRTKRYCY